jgi:hypothetical protein
MSEWQDIETAPKDGSSILACDARIEGWQQVVYWDDEAKAPHMWGLADGPHYHVDMFTHWMPLPPPPLNPIIGREK